MNLFVRRPGKPYREAAIADVIVWMKEREGFVIEVPANVQWDNPKPVGWRWPWQPQPETVLKRYLILPLEVDE